ncbi:hypothetical protein M3Y98_00232500 [Aphelenchoides besseyi]|nr:hypothetical protein M3Y98_00232500 [Aphelenchoides besseyi]KAI6200601.1 hypothetical protein M3Y96_00751300 [Aphelenchoides besseyi]
MRSMNGRLPFHLPLRTPLVRQPHRNQNRRRSSEALPKSIQFDESADAYRCFCGCFHVKTGTYSVAIVEMLFIVFYFLNALLVVLQQKHGYDDDTSTDYAGVAFIATAIGCALATLIILLMIVGIKRNIAALLFPHLIMQVIVLLILLALLIIGAIAVITDTALFYRILNAAPFYEHPGQSTVALPLDTVVRVYFVLCVHVCAFILEVYFLIVLFNCQTFIYERTAYFRYCLAYSKPMETLR